jgi:hypothetical protein
MKHAWGLRGNGEPRTMAQGERGGARVPAVEREIDGSGHGGARGNAQLSRTVASKTARWLVQRRGGGGGAWRAGNRAEAVRRWRNTVVEVVRCSTLARVFPNGTERASEGEKEWWQGRGCVARAWEGGGVRRGLDLGMKTDRIRTDITDIVFVFIFMSGFGFEYG